MPGLTLQDPWTLQDAGDFSSGAEEQQADAGSCETGDLGDFAVGVVFGMG
jgi:hypothetical protein